MRELRYIEAMIDGCEPPIKEAWYAHKRKMLTDERGVSERNLAYMASAFLVGADAQATFEMHRRARIHPLMSSEGRFRSLTRNWISSNGPNG